jgi:hypothetical protein
MSGFDYEKPKMDPDEMPIPYPKGKRTRTCRRCGQQWYTEEMIQLGDKNGKWYCYPCYDPPYGEGPHKRGDRY